MANRFQDKTAVVTGAGSGIGRAVAIRLVSEGASILGIDTNEEGLKETKTLLSNPDRITLAVVSITDEKHVIEEVNKYAAEQGHIDVLVNLAAIIRCDLSTEATLESFQNVLNTNLVGTFLMCRTCLPHLIKSKGNIVNVASTAAMFGHPYMAAYSASKGAVIALTKALAQEYIGDNVRVNAVAPGGTLTPLLQQVQFPPSANTNLLGRLRLHGDRLALPEEIAAFIVVLASSDAVFVNGEVVRIDGGLHG